MTFGKPVVRKGRKFFPDLIGDVTHDVALGHPRVQASPNLLHTFSAPFRTHCLTKLICFGCGEPRDIDRHLHQLLLKERNAQCFRERFLEKWMEIRDGLLAVPTPNIWVDRSALDRTRPNQCTSTTRS